MAAPARTGPQEPTERLLSLYERAARRLRLLARQAAHRGAEGTAAYYEGQARMAHAILARLQRESRPLVGPAIARPYAVGAGAADALVGRPDIAFGGIHADAVLELAKALDADLGAAIAEVGRRTDDLYRRVGLRAVAEGTAGALTRRQISATLVRDLELEGVTGFTDRAGRRWALDTYARMVARTTSREAHSVATRNRLVEVDRPIVRVSDHDTETALCERYEGKTFSLVRRRGYVTLRTLPPFHPNCKHIIVPAEANLTAAIRAMDRAENWEQLERLFVREARAAA
jgi:hypothetical protein